MTVKSNYQPNRNRARTSSGGGGGMPIMIGGGGLGTLLLVGLFFLLGGDPGTIQQTSPQNQQQTEGTYNLDHCQTAEDANKHDDCRALAAAESVDGVWKDVLPQQAGIEYTQPGLELFQGAVRSGCGMASSDTGPFYCPGDQSVYLDVSFYKQLTQLGGNNGELAQMYVVAHEIGHHIQKLEGTLSLSNYNDPGEDSAAVAIELQADCYAGMWANRADKGENAIIEPITREQVKQAVETARAIGDDHIQERSGREVNPDLWTHGSSEQRQEAFLKGYNSGSMKQCDYLNRGVYK